MTESRLWQSEQGFLLITCEGESDIIGNMLMLKRNRVLPSHEAITTTCLGSDVADLEKVDYSVNNVTSHEDVTT